MSRAEIRRLKRQEAGKTATYNFTAEQLANLRNSWTQGAVDQAFVLLMCIPIMVLKEQYRWGSRKRLPEFAEHLSTYYQEFRDSKLDVWDYAEQAQNYTGVGFELAQPSEIINAVKAMTPGGLK